MLTPQSYDQAVDMRVRIFDEMSDDREVVAYVNIGGGTAAVGTAEDKSKFLPGLNTEVPTGLANRSVMRTYLSRGVPAIHVSQIRTLARRYGLTDAPSEVPAVGDGAVFRQEVISRWVLGVGLLLIFVLMWGATRFDLFAVLNRSQDDKSSGPSQMV